MKTLASTILQRILPLAAILIAAAPTAFAQSELPHRKPGTEITVSEAPIKSLAPTQRPVRHGDKTDAVNPDVPRYDRIDTPIRWYAIENADNPEYWDGVDAQHIRIQLEFGYGFDEPAISDFLAAQGFSKVIRESGGMHRGLVRIYQYEGPEATTVVDWARAARRVPGISFLEPTVKYENHFEPNDPYYPQQWGPYVSFFDLAWDESIGGNSLNVVAVIDDACDWNHEDLYDVVWYGWDYAQNDGDISPDDPYNHKHGTHTTGTVAAKTNNGVGVAGMVSDTVYFAKVGTPDGNLSDPAIIDAIYDIASIDRIMAVNMSLGGDSPSAAIEQACNYAYNAGKLLVVSSGNNGQGTVAYPAAYPSTIAVGAIGTDGSNLYLTNYSQYGDAQELVAPGGDMQSNYGIVSCIPMNQYEAMEGTSMAAPHVTGLAGLMKNLNMDLTHTDIRNILAATAIDYGETGWDPIFGYGMIHAQNAVLAAITGTVGVSTSSANPGLRMYPNPVADRLLVDPKLDGTITSYEVMDMSGRIIRANHSTSKRPMIVSVAEFADGIYLLRVHTTSGSAVAKFIKR